MRICQPHDRWLRGCFPWGPRGCPTAPLLTCTLEAKAAPVLGSGLNSALFRGVLLDWLRPRPLEPSNPPHPKARPGRGLRETESQEGLERPGLRHNPMTGSCEPGPREPGKAGGGGGNAGQLQGAQAEGDCLRVEGGGVHLLQGLCLPNSRGCCVRRAAQSSASPPHSYGPGAKLLHAARAAVHPSRRQDHRPPKSPSFPKPHPRGPATPPPHIILLAGKMEVPGATRTRPGGW